MEVPYHNSLSNSNSKIPSNQFNQYLNHNSRSFQIKIYNRLQIKRWTLSLMTWGLNSCRHKIKMSFLSLFSFSRQDSWRSKCRFSNKIRKAWMRWLITFWTKMPQGVVRQTWDSRFFKRIVLWCYRWWPLWVNNLMKWRYYMKTLNPLLQTLETKLMNLKRSWQCKVTFT